MSIKSILSCLLALALVPILPVFAEPLSYLDDADYSGSGEVVFEATADPLLIDSNLVLCEYVYRDESEEKIAERCADVSDSEPLVISGMIFKPPRDRELILDHINLKISGYNTYFSLASPGVTIMDSTISNTHGCLFTLSATTAQRLIIVSGTFRTEANTASASDMNDTAAISPFCTTVTDPAEADTLLRTVLAADSEFYRQDAETRLTTVNSGTKSSGKLGDIPVAYLASAIVIVRERTTPEADPEEDPDDPAEDQPVIPKAPDTSIAK